MSDTEAKTVYYCGHCQKRPEEVLGREIIKRNHGVCVARVALPIIEGVSRTMTNMAYVSKGEK